MIIKYIHISAPETEKIFDTEKVLKKNPCIHLSQKEFDEMELERLQKDKEKGYILQFKIQ